MVFAGHYGDSFNTTKEVEINNSKSSFYSLPPSFKKLSTSQGQTLLDRVLRVLFTVVGGYLIVDDTVVEKPHAQLLSEAGWVCSSKRNQIVYGVSVVLVVWT